MSFLSANEDDSITANNSSLTTTKTQTTTGATNGLSHPQSSSTDETDEQRGYVAASRSISDSGSHHPIYSRQSETGRNSSVDRLNATRTTFSREIVHRTLQKHSKISHHSSKTQESNNDSEEKKLDDRSNDRHERLLNNRYHKYFSKTTPTLSTTAKSNVKQQSIQTSSDAGVETLGANSGHDREKEHAGGNLSQDIDESMRAPRRVMTRRHLRSNADDRDTRFGIQNHAAVNTAEAEPPNPLQQREVAKRFLVQPSFEYSHDEEAAETDSKPDTLETKPQHQTDALPAGTVSNSTERYYRVCYRGVVALLAEPDENAARSGTYLGYGEIFSSRFQLPTVPTANTELTGKQAEAVAPLDHTLHNEQQNLARGIIDSPPRSVISQYTAGSISSLDTFQSRSTISAHTSSTFHEGGQKRLAQPNISLIESHGERSPPVSPASQINESRHSINTAPGKAQTEPSEHVENNLVIRVDRVLTGGYAVDGLGGLESIQSSSSFGQVSCIGGDFGSPKRSVVSLPHVESSPDHSVGGMSHYTNRGGALMVGGEQSRLGFLFLRKKNEPIVEEIDYTPELEEGYFQYRVVSSAPLPIYSGPSLDAPRIKAMALPGTVHDVSLKLRFVYPTNKNKCNNTRDAPIWFLRLSHRRGWVLDKKKARKDNSEQWVAVMREVSHPDDGASSVGDDFSAVSSVASSSALTPTAAGARRRHRPPRKRRDVASSAANNKDHHLSTIARSNTSKQLNTSVGFTTPVKSMPKGSDHNCSMMTPSSTVSILSDESSLDRSGTVGRNGSVPTSPDFSQTSTIASTATSNVDSIGQNAQRFYLIRVTAPGGMKILDTPQFQVSHLIRGKTSAPSSQNTSQQEASLSSKSRHSIFQTMTGRLGTSSAGISTTGNNTLYSGTNSTTRVLPCGNLFEASKPVESSGLYGQGAGLIKLSDGSGWAVVPRKEELAQQYRAYSRHSSGATEDEEISAFEEVGHAVIESLPVLAFDSTVDRSISRTKWVRVVSRAGVLVSCPPALTSNEDVPTPSKDSSAIGKESDIASSVASSFVDAMFRSPKKKSGTENYISNDSTPTTSRTERQMISSRIPCGMCVEVEKFLDERPPEFVRLVGGQGWVHLATKDKSECVVSSTPEFRFGSFWFRVQATKGIKVRLGPSKRAPSIKSEEGIYFRFECGEFLRASEVMTVFGDDNNKKKPLESFVKLYRNRHVRLHQGHEEFRSLQSLSAQSEWVQVFSEDELYLEQCNHEPQIERHKQGWRYSVVSAEGMVVRKGPSFSSERTGTTLKNGDTAVITERVSPAAESITWLRMRDGEGWLHDTDEKGNRVVVESQRARSKAEHAAKRPQPQPREEAAYNVLISRLFHNDPAKSDGQSNGVTKDCR